jgi:hypothetical protein
MNHRLVNYIFAIALGIGFASMHAPLSSADDSKTSDKAPDFSKYTTVTTKTGEVTKADEKKITIRIKSTVNKQTNPRYAPNFVEVNKDYEYQFLPESLVRTSFIPKKTDEKGKKVELSQKEKDALKTPIGVPHYAASFSDLVPGSTVFLTLIRDKSISEAKATDADLRVKYAVIESLPSTTTTPAPPAKK